MTLCMGYLPRQCAVYAQSDHVSANSAQQQTPSPPSICSIDCLILNRLPEMAKHTPQNKHSKKYNLLIVGTHSMSIIHNSGVEGNI